MAKTRALVRHAKSAKWATRFAFFSVILFVATLASRQMRLTDDPALAVLLAVIFGTAILSVTLGCVALTIIWREGLIGVRNAIIGLVTGLLVLAPAIYAAVMILFLPQLNDLSTDLDVPPAFLKSADAYDRRAEPRYLAGEETRDIQLETYPDLRSVTYQIGIEEVYQTAVRVAEDYRWDIMFTEPPVDQDARGVIYAAARTRFLKFIDDVVLRIEPREEGTVVDIRSRSRFGAHDVGVNAARIRSFQNALSAELAEEFGSAVLLTRQEESANEE